jgi:molybdopterin molybdotransferase
VAEGSTVLTLGARLRPQDIGLATSVGREMLTVRRRVNVGVIATGDELRAPGQPLPPGCIYDTNRYTVSAALEALGARVTMYPSAIDTSGAIRAAFLQAAEDNDLVISTGGVSTGDEDYVKSVVEDVGSLDFWRLPIKPGRPIAVGEVRGTPFVGLPGNPVSALVTFWLIGRPLVLQLMGASASDPVRFPVIAEFEHERQPGRRELLRARLEYGTDGRLGAQTHHSTSSGVLSSLTWSDGLVEIPEDSGDVRVGDVVSFIPYHGLD